MICCSWRKKKRNMANDDGDPVDQLDKSYANDGDAVDQVDKTYANDSDAVYSDAVDRLDKTLWVRIIQFTLQPHHNKRSVLPAVHCLRQVNRLLRDACDDESVWLAVASGLRPKAVQAKLEETCFETLPVDLVDRTCKDLKEAGLPSADHTTSESMLRVIKNTHKSGSFVGFGHGQKYDESEEGMQRAKDIAVLEDRINKVTAKLNSLVLHGRTVPPPLGHSSWAPYVGRIWAQKWVCMQCDGKFREADNHPDACEYHSSGGGCVFDWDEDDFIGVGHTCCHGAKNTPGCQRGWHNSEDGRFSDENKNRNWSTAHM